MGDEAADVPEWVWEERPVPGAVDERPGPAGGGGLCQTDSPNRVGSIPASSSSSEVNRKGGTSGRMVSHYVV